MGLHAHAAAGHSGLDAMAHGVFNQRLQHERRHARCGHAGVDVPAHIQALTKTHLFDGQVTLRQCDFFEQRHRSADIRQGHAK